MTRRLQAVLSSLLPPTGVSLSTTMAAPLHERLLPSFDELPPFKNFSGCAWGVWGPDDQLGTVNLLTDQLVKQATTEEIR
jgi:hypothetical protein